MSNYQRLFKNNEDIISPKLLWLLSVSTVHSIIERSHYTKGCWGGGGYKLHYTLCNVFVASKKHWFKQPRPCELFLSVNRLFAKEFDGVKIIYT